MERLHKQTKGFLIKGIDTEGKRISYSTDIPNVNGVIRGHLYHFRQSQTGVERKLCARINQGRPVFTNYGLYQVVC